MAASRSTKSMHSSFFSWFGRMPGERARFLILPPYGDVHLRRLDLDALDAVSEGERLPDFGVGYARQNIIADEVIQNRPLDGHAGDLHAVQVHGGLPAAGADVRHYLHWALPGKQL